MFRKFRQLGEIRRAVLLVWESAPGPTLFTGILGLLLGLLPLVVAWCFKLLVDQIASPSKGAGNTVPTLVLGVAGASLMLAMLRIVMQYTAERQVAQVSDRMKTLLNLKAVEIDLEYYEDPKYQDSLRRAQQEAPTRPVRIVNSLLALVQNGCLLSAASVLVVMKFPWWALAAVLAAGLPALWIKTSQAKRIFDWERKHTQKEREAGYVEMLLSMEWFAKELRLFALGPLFIKRSEKLRGELLEGRRKISLARAIGEGVSQVLGVSAFYLAFGAIAWKAWNGSSSVGDVVLLYTVLGRVQGAAQEFIGGLSGIFENKLFLDHLYAFLDAKPRLVEAVNPSPVPKVMASGIRFENVGFTYPGHEKPVLSGLDFEIRPGKLVALVGENGAGKTTLVKLLCRLYDPKVGRITMDGVDLREFKSEELRRQFSVVFQDFVRYHLSAADNIGVGDVERMDRAEIIAAAKYAGAHEIIERMPKGYDTLLGRYVEDGEELSIGQWQRVALARAFLRKAPVIILDEPTSALDARAEHEVFQRFAELSAGRTGLLISHRLSTVRMADEILMLEHGKIIERGSHDVLYSLGGKYAALFDLQARYYR